MFFFYEQNTSFSPNKPKRTHTIKQKCDSLTTFCRSDLSLKSCSNLFPLLCSVILNTRGDAQIGLLALEQLLRLVELQVWIYVFNKISFLLTEVLQIYSVLSYSRLCSKFVLNIKHFPRLHWLHKPSRSSCTSWAPLPGPPSNQICLPTTCSPTCRPWPKTGL